MSVELQRRLFTVDEYHAMARSGVFSDDDRVELIGGEIVEMAPIGSRHAACVNRLTHLLSQRLSGTTVVAVQNPVRLSDLAEPQPDVALLRPKADFYAARLPRPSDILLLIEVADEALAYDREVKLPLYARSGVAETWIVDLTGEMIEMHRSPTKDGYAESVHLRRGDTVRPNGIAGLEIEVDEVLGE